MKKFSLDNIEDILVMVANRCPEEVIEELSKFQSDCEIFDNCFDCWYRTVSAYQYEQSLKSMYDESEDK